MSVLPGLLQEIADVAGPGAAMLLADQVGGQTVWISGKAEEMGWLVDIVGSEAATKIRGHFAVENGDGNVIGNRITIPLGPSGVMARARRVAIKAIQAGATAREAAQRSGLHERTIFRIKERMGKRHNSLQADLFG